MQIMSGKLKPGDKLSSVRELALELGVNPNTIQRALSELERDGLIYTERAVGRYVSEDLTLIEEYRKQKVAKNIRQFVQEMNDLGVKKEDIICYLQNDKEGL